MENWPNNFLKNAITSGGALVDEDIKMENKNANLSERIIGSSQLEAPE